MNTYLLFETARKRFQAHSSLEELPEEEVLQILSSMANLKESREVVANILNPHEYNVGSLILAPEENSLYTYKVEKPTFCCITHYAGRFRGICYDFTEIDISLFAEMYMFSHLLTYQFFEIDHFSQDQYYATLYKTVCQFQSLLQGYICEFHPEKLSPIQVHADSLINTYRQELIDFINSLRK